MKTFLASLLLMLSLYGLQAQTVTVTVMDSEKQTLPGASVQLIRLDDSLTRSGITNIHGQLRFEAARDGRYQLLIRFMGYQPLDKTLHVHEGQRAFTFRMSKDVITLGEVAVVARKPLIRQEDDKMIVDPEPMAQSATNTLEVLEATPGVYVDQEGGIFLNTASPAVVYINGREMKMSQQDLAAILRSLPPGSVQRIEILRTPSTRYDASSAGGIVNIVLKKGVNLGRHGSLQAGMNQGKAGNAFTGANLHYSGERHSYYLNLNYSYQGGYENMDALRYLDGGNAIRQSALTTSGSRQGYLGFGLNYNWTDSLSLSYDTRLNINDKTSVSDHQNIIESSLPAILSESMNTLENNSSFVSVQQDLGLLRIWDSLGSEWDTKLSFSYLTNETDQDYVDTYLPPFSLTKTGDGENLQQRFFFVFQSEITRAWRSRIKLETGIKSSYQPFRSNTAFWISGTGIRTPDTSRNSTFRHQEAIQAAYAQVSLPLPAEITMKTGVRLEHTFMEGQQTIPVDTSFVVRRLDWFPYLYLSRSLITIAGFDMKAFLIYRRTIARPGYGLLNPAVRYVDAFLYETGNPDLLPQFTDNIEANISFDERPIFAIGRNYVRDIFTNVIYQEAEPSVRAVRTYDNIGKNRETYFQAAGAIPPGGRYFFVLGIQYNLTTYDGRYDGIPVSFTRDGWRFFTFHSLKLSEQTRLTMFGFMMHKGLQNFYELNTFGQLNFGLTQTFLDKKLTLTLSARDVLRTMVTGFSLNQVSIRSSGERYMDNRRFGFQLRYQFGVIKKPEKQDMMPFGEED